MKERSKVKNYFKSAAQKSSNKDIKGAIDDYTKALEIDSQLIYAYYNRGVLKDLIGDYQGELLDFQRVFEINPKFQDKFLKYGHALIRRTITNDWKRNKGAETDFEEILVKDPKNAFAYANCAILQTSQDAFSIKFEEAIDCCNKVIEICPEKFPWIHLFLGLIKRDLNNALDFKFGHDYAEHGAAKDCIYGYYHSLRHGCFYIPIPFQRDLFEFK